MCGRKTPFGGNTQIYMHKNVYNTTGKRKLQKAIGPLYLGWYSPHTKGFFWYGIKPPFLSFVEPQFWQRFKLKLVFEMWRKTSMMIVLRRDKCHSAPCGTIIACYTPAGGAQLLLQTVMLHSWCWNCAPLARCSSQLATNSSSTRRRDIWDVLCQWVKCTLEMSQ